MFQGRLAKRFEDPHQRRQRKLMKLRSKKSLDIGIERKASGNKVTLMEVRRNRKRGEEEEEKQKTKDSKWKENLLSAKS
ncbi:hypothetical protein RUM43_012709 [Polyplax serrata]|uniref:Uncharacterized protein n=1 Tax=Polyplax serrata TaxID=468196 RepID=A0AAN8P2D7_POLSC